jgi:hypothetical protein
MPTYPQAFTYRDDKGNVARVSMFVTAADLAAAAAAMTTLQPLQTALSNCVLVNAKGPYTTSPAAAGYGANAEYETVEDKAVMTFVTASGALHRYQIPAPKSALFLADGETIDPANATVAAYTAGVIAQLVSSRDGSDITAYIGGVRIRRKLQKRTNIYTLAPNLTIPAQ